MKIRMKKKTDNISKNDRKDKKFTENLVVDREIWKEISNQEIKEKASLQISGIHLPKILLHSEDAKKANEEIDDLAEKVKDAYEDSIENASDLAEDLNKFVSSTYSFYQDDKILSIFIDMTKDPFDENEKYKIYNFSLPEGDLIKDTEVLKKLGFNDDQILLAMENTIANDFYFKKTFEIFYMGNVDFINESQFIEGSSLINFWKSYSDNKSSIYLDEAGKPYFVYDQYSSALDKKLVKVSKLDSIPYINSEFSSNYFKIANKLGIKDEKNKGFIIYMGEANDEGSLIKMAKKLFLWQIIYNDYKDPNLLLDLRENPDNKNLDLIGSEFYLFIPKYENSVVSLKELQLDSSGQPKETENDILDKMAVRGPVLICQSPSETAPSAKIKLQYRDDFFEFSPSISGKDGSLILPDEIIDAEKIIDWDRLIESETYSYVLYEKIMKFMHKG